MWFPKLVDPIAALGSGMAGDGFRRKGAFCGKLDHDLGDGCMQCCLREWCLYLPSATQNWWSAIGICPIYQFALGAIPFGAKDGLFSAFRGVPHLDIIGFQVHMVY